jgi:hypothetical protein
VGRGHVRRPGISPPLAAPSAPDHRAGQSGVFRGQPARRPYRGRHRDRHLHRVRDETAPHLATGRAVVCAHLRRARHGVCPRFMDGSGQPDRGHLVRACGRGRGGDQEPARLHRRNPGACAPRRAQPGAMCRRGWPGTCSTNSQNRPSRRWRTSGRRAEPRWTSLASTIGLLRQPDDRAAPTEPSVGLARRQGCE